jgi:hypothetical protein
MALRGRLDTLALTACRASRERRASKARLEHKGLPDSKERSVLKVLRVFKAY